MKRWTEPKLSVIDLKMDENIASSAGNETAYETLFLLYGNSGVNNSDGARYYCRNGFVQDTGVRYVALGSGRYHINRKDIGVVAGCLA